MKYLLSKEFKRTAVVQMQINAIILKRQYLEKSNISKASDVLENNQ